MAAPTDLPEETRHQIANDCERAAHLLETEGWQRHRVWRVSPRHTGVTSPSYTGGSLCAIGALAVAHNETRMRNLDDIENVYRVATACPAGHAVTEEITRRAVGTGYEPIVRRYQESIGEGDELRGSIIFDWNDSWTDAEGMISLLRDVAAKHRPDATDGGLM